MFAPSPLLLLWCGLAATIAAGIAGAIVAHQPLGWSLAHRPRSRSHAVTWSLGAGLIAYPLAYGVLFELLHRADVGLGMILGALHGIVMFLLATPRSNRRGALRTAIMHLVYGAVIALLYVTP